MCADIDADKVDRLRRGEVDIPEPGLPELVGEGLAAGRLRFTGGIDVVDDPIDAAEDAAALVVLTEWPQFRTPDRTALGGVIENRVVVDTRNLLDGDILRRAGFTWMRLGRGRTAHS